MDAPYCKEFIEFINYATTVYHAVDYAISNLKQAGYVELLESEDWTPKLRPGGKYYTTRNDSSLIAFHIEQNYIPGNPLAIIASHIDSLCLKLKPVSNIPSKGGFERLGVAPYSGGGANQTWDASYSTWWDRDLGLAGKVIVRGKEGLESRLVSLGKPIARIPSLAVHFGDPALGPFNYETNFVPIIGLTDSPSTAPSTLNTSESTAPHSKKLLKALSHELGLSTSRIVDFSLELYDYQPASLLGLSKEFISGPRLDDKLCAFAALWALINSSPASPPPSQSASPKERTKKGIIKISAFFDNEEIGSPLRYGAKSNFLQSVIERVVEAQVNLPAPRKSPYTHNLIAQTLSTSLLISSDVAHALNPNFSDAYLEGLSPELNKGIVIKLDPNGHYTSDAPGVVLMRLIAERSQSEIQLIHGRNDLRTGSTIGPTLSERLGIPSVDVGIPQLSMHSVRAITGNEDPGLGVRIFEGFYREFGALSGCVEF